MSDNPSAFPFQASNDHDALTPEYGMTLRDWFAGQALVGLIARADDLPSKPICAGAAYEMADAMLAERGKA